MLPKYGNMNSIGQILLKKLFTFFLSKENKKKTCFFQKNVLIFFNIITFFIRCILKFYHQEICSF